MLAACEARALPAAPLATGPSPEVARHWQDGQAELAAYALKQPRYGELRSGTVVLIYVTEPFSESARVKADPGRHPAADVFPALKLNVAKDFQTGIYDYNLMTSVFVAMTARGGQRAGAPTKLVFSGQEWCGALFEELLFDADAVRQERFSYFDGEGDQKARLPRPAGGLTVDELPMLVRSLPVPYLAPGASREVELLPSLERTRLVHKELAWKKGTVSRSQERGRAEVPAGAFEVETWTADLGGGERYEYLVEVAFPHRLVGWRGPEGEEGRLLGAKRLPYWQLNGEGMEKHLESLGLQPPRR